MHTQEASNGESIFECRRDFDRASRNVKSYLMQVG